MTGQRTAGPSIAHMVYFTLRDASATAQQTLIDACNRNLRSVPGIKFFAVGPLVSDLARSINVRDFHVGLHLVFESRNAHDDYQVDARHQRFIDENKDNWQQVRIFDCQVS